MTRTNQKKEETQAKKGGANYTKGLKLQSLTQGMYEARRSWRLLITFWPPRIRYRAAASWHTDGFLLPLTSIRSSPWQCHVKINDTSVGLPFLKKYTLLLLKVLLLRFPFCAQKNYRQEFPESGKFSGCSITVTFSPHSSLTRPALLPKISMTHFNKSIDIADMFRTIHLTPKSTRGRKRYSLNRSPQFFRNRAKRTPN